MRFFNNAIHQNKISLASILMTVTLAFSSGCTFTIENKTVSDGKNFSATATGTFDLSTADTSSTPVDAGSTPTDSGSTPVVDIDSTPTDSGSTPVVDTGSTPTDNGSTPVVDTGSVPTDTPPDGDGTPTDTASTPADSGAGWTSLSPSSDSRLIYVSSSDGSDQNNGLSPQKPKKTIAAGKSLMRDNMPDWLMLKRGDVFNEAFGKITTSGRSLTEPAVISSYGTSKERPKLMIPLSGSSFGAAFEALNKDYNYIAIVGLHMQPNGRTTQAASSGIRWLTAGEGILVEDCYIAEFANGVLYQGYYNTKIQKNFKFRRNVVFQNYNLSTQGHSQGIYVENNDGLLIEENIFIHNGWNENIPGAIATIFNHNIYVQNGNTNIAVRGNIIAEGASHGIQLRPGGVLTENLFVRNGINILVGGGTTPEADGVYMDVTSNFIYGGRNIDTNNRGWGFDLIDPKDGIISGNIFSSNDDGYYPFGLSLTASKPGRKLLIEKNKIFNWDRALTIRATAGNYQAVTIRNNDFVNRRTPFMKPEVIYTEIPSASGIISQNNRFYTTAASNLWSYFNGTVNGKSLAYWMNAMLDTTSKAENPNYADPTRSPMSYHLSKGGAGGLDGFYSVLKNQSKEHWNPEYSTQNVANYLRDGFTE